MVLVASVPGHCLSFTFHYFVLVVTCSAPASVPNSSRSQEPPYNYNTSLTYTCDSGHELSSGDAIRTCTASASWSGTAPTCSRRSRDQNAITVYMYFSFPLLLYLALRLSVKVKIIRFIVATCPSIITYGVILNIH